MGSQEFGFIFRPNVQRSRYTMLSYLKQLRAHNFSFRLPDSEPTKFKTFGNPSVEIYSSALIGIANTCLVRKCYQNIRPVNGQTSFRKKKQFLQ